MKLRAIAFACLTGSLTACGGGPGSDSATNVNGVPLVAAALPEDNNQDPYVSAVVTNSEDFSKVPATETGSIVARSDFLFDTSRTVKLSINLIEANGTQSSLSICTDYQANEANFEVNYNSCPIKTTMLNGQFTHNMELMNQFDTAIAVIWFPNQEFDPLYREIDINDFTVSAQNYEWNWN